MMGLPFLLAEGVMGVRKIKMNCQKSITFEEGCNLYLQNCKERNLREDTIRHYRQSYLRFYRYFERTMPLREMTLQKYNGFVLHLREEISNDVSINSCSIETCAIKVTV